MANERLRAAISAKGETIQSVAEHIGVDPKSVERWITTSRTPHRGHRWKAASFLGVDEVYLWPSVEKQAEKASTSELITYYPHRGAVPAPLWSSLIEKATDQVDILVYAGLFLFDSHPDLPDQLAEKAKAGARSASCSATPTPKRSVSVAKKRASAATWPHARGSPAATSNPPCRHSASKSACTTRSSTTRSIGSTRTFS